MTRRVRVVVSGRVQGVGFRYVAAKAAWRLGLAGHVRNLSDGTVEAEIEGADADVEAMLGVLREGPRAAQVSGMSVEELAPRGQTGFDVDV